MKSRPTCRLRLRAIALAILSVQAIAACSPGPMPVSASKTDPSNPSAPEGVATDINTGNRAAHSTTTEHDAHQGHDHRTAADSGLQLDMYVCPMHPEVTSKSPGLCPKCNMKLVPKK